MTEPSPATVSGEGPTKPALVEALGGKRGLIDSGLPAIVFVLVNSVVQAFGTREVALNAAMIASVAIGLVIICFATPA